MLHIRCDRCNALWRIEANSLLNQFTVTLSQKGRADPGVIVGKAQDLRFWNRVRARVRKRSEGERTTEEVRQAIDELFQAYFTGLRLGDVASVAALYTENAIQLPPDRTIIRGRPQLQSSANEAIHGENTMLTERELSVSGDVAYECGRYTEKVRLNGQEPLKLGGKYLVVFKRTADGWKIDREIWNIQPPLDG